MKKIIAFFTVLFLGYQVSFAQDVKEKPNKSDVRTIDGVEFSHKWVREKWYACKSPKVLKIKAKNTNSYSVNVEFGVDFYLNGMLRESSDTVNICINPEVTRSGRENKMVFKSAELSQDDLKSEAFQFEISNLKIIKMRSCSEKE